MPDGGEPMPRWLHSSNAIGIGMLLAFLTFLPFGGLYNIPLLVLCGLGAWRLVSRPRKALGDDGVRLLLVLFACVWLPMTIAAVDAVNPVQSWRKVVSFPVFFLAGVYVVTVLRRTIDLRRLLVGVLAICVFWSVDASWQFISGFNLLGFLSRAEESQVSFIRISSWASCWRRCRRLSSRPRANSPSAAYG